MNPENILAGTASLFTALGDKTRLRLLNLMRDREICVSSFTGTLGHSQPLISRHLAYLRNTGVVEARRDGKWIHYSISSKLDDNTGRLLIELFRWMEGQDGLRKDREQYQESYPEAAKPKLEKRKAARVRTTQPPRRVLTQTKTELSFEHQTETETVYEDVQAEETFTRPHHNELEDFLL